MHVKKTEGADIQGGVSMDQIAAKALGADTQLASLELAIESVEFLGACDSGYSCAYANTIAWRSPTTPLPMENEPRAVFERLFGGSDSTDLAARTARIAKEKSILDSVTRPGQRAAARAWAIAIRSRSTSTSRRCATSSGAFRRPRSRAHGSCPSSIGRPAFPARSRSTPA